VYGRDYYQMKVDHSIEAIQAFCAPLLGQEAVSSFLAERREESAKESAPWQIQDSEPVP